jgi:putative intracellular protease/amidase
MKALIVCTSHHEVTSAPPTGIWLSDLTHFVETLAKRRIPFTLVSPKGGAIPIDERSLDNKDKLNQKWLENADFKQQLSSALTPAEVRAEDYLILYIVGGYGALWDLPDHEGLQHIIKTLYERNGMVCAVGHGVSALLNVRLSEGVLLIQDKYLTAFSSLEEKMIRSLPPLPMQLEEELRKRGANYTKSYIPFVTHIEVDERLVTGQNTNSAYKVASKVMEEMFEK